MKAGSLLGCRREGGRAHAWKWEWLGSGVYEKTPIIIIGTGFPGRLWSLGDFQAPGSLAWSPLA